MLAERPDGFGQTAGISTIEDVLTTGRQQSMVHSETAVRPIGTERCGTGRAFGKSSRIDLIVQHISECLLPVMKKFRAATKLFRDPYGIVCCVLFTSIEIKKQRSVFGDRSK
jgi:hypothetical protein